MVHEDTPDDAWHHNVKSHIARIRTKANTASLIQRGHYPYSHLINLEEELWNIANTIDNDVVELFQEIRRLKNKCNEV
jgi:hypothetical protein